MRLWTEPGWSLGIVGDSLGAGEAPSIPDCKAVSPGMGRASQRDREVKISPQSEMKENLSPFIK